MEIINTETYTAKPIGDGLSWLVFGTHCDTIGAVIGSGDKFKAYRKKRIVGTFKTLEKACEKLVKMDRD